MQIFSDLSYVFRIFPPTLACFFLTKFSKIYRIPNSMLRERMKTDSMRENIVMMCTEAILDLPISDLIRKKISNIRF